MKLASKLASNLVGFGSDDEGDGVKRQIVVVRESNAAIAIPAFAQGGNGIVYVTGCGAGASGGVSNATDGDQGGGGGSGAQAIRHPIAIPSGSTTCAIVIGAAGAAASTTTAVDGNAGGDTTLTIGSTVLTLQGGAAGTGASEGGGLGGIPYMGAAIVMGSLGGRRASQFGGVSSVLQNDTMTGMASGATLLRGSAGLTGADFNSGGQGAGGYSFFGPGGPGRSANVTARYDGTNATGYGAGGEGGCAFGTNTTTVSGAGSPGLMILEFVEGAA